MRTATAAVLAGSTAVALIAATGCGDDSPSEPEVLLELDGIEPGQFVSMRAEGTVVEWVDRLGGRILRIDADDPPEDADEVEVVATVEVGTDGAQRGLLGATVLGDRRFAAWTQPDTNELVVGELVVGTAPVIVWEGGGTASGAIGGHLDVLDGRLVLGVGQLTDFARQRNALAAPGAPEPDGALLSLDPDGPPDQQPEILSEGYINPFAFTVTTTGALWVADNSVDDDDAERIGRGDLADRGEHQRLDGPERAPAAIVELADVRLGVCGFLDEQMVVYRTVEGSDGGQPGGVEASAAVGPCQTAAAVLDDGDVVTVVGGMLTRIPAP